LPLSFGIESVLAFVRGALVSFPGTSFRKETAEHECRRSDDLSQAGYWLDRSVARRARPAPWLIIPVSEAEFKANMGKKEVLGKAVDRAGESSETK